MESNEQADAEPRFGLHGVTLLHGQRHIIQDVTLAILPGEFHALIGSRNSGKSAVAAVLAGSLPFASGTVLLNGRHHAQVTGRLARQAGVNVVSGVPKVFQKLTVAENLLSGEPLWRRALRSWRGFLRDIQAWLTHSGIDLPLFQTLDSMPPEDWIFVELLGRLYRSPRLLIMDEALESLAPARRRILMPVLRKRMAEGMAVLWITHKIEDAMLMTDRLSVIRNGKLLLSASSGDLDQLTLIQLCYSQIEERDETDATMEQFRQLMRFTGALIRDLPQAVAILDMERRVRFLNRRASLLFADGPDNGMGSRLDELLGTANRQHADTVLLAMDQSGEGEWHNLPIRHANGEMLADVILRRILEHARPVGYMVQIEDVSAREELRRRLILSENLAAVGLLAAGVAHEVNNPLEIIGNYLAYLKKMTGDADTRNVLRKIEEEGRASSK